MPVTRLRTRSDAGRQATLEAVRVMLDGVAGAEDVAAFVDRKLAAGRGWKFVMVDPVAYAGVVSHLFAHSRRKQKAVQLFTRLFQFLPPDGNEVLADRGELARVTGCTPDHVSEIMGELEAMGAVYRRRGRPRRSVLRQSSARHAPRRGRPRPRPGRGATSQATAGRAGRTLSPDP